MAKRYWLIHPNGGRQLIDPRRFNLVQLAQQARLLGGQLVVEQAAPRIAAPRAQTRKQATVRSFDPPLAAVASLFRSRFGAIHACKTDYQLDVNRRVTVRVLGGYYRRRRLVRIYALDRDEGRRPLEELFDTFLHEMAHHIEYTEPETFDASACQRVPGRMHSPLFWKIFGELKQRWAYRQHAASPVVEIPGRDVRVGPTGE